VSKNNSVEFDPPARLFELRDGFRWTGVDFNLIAEDLYNKKKNKGRPAEKRDDVKTEISRLLEGGEAMPSTELEAKVCELTGCHAQTIKAAKKDLGVESFQSGQKWYSRLPGQSTINTQSMDLLYSDRRARG
jgi:hypothetical protein